jgi:hypothetical protein
MPTALPSIRGGLAQVLYPFTQTFICQTGMSDSETATPARWVKGPPLVRFEFGYRPINQADRDTLKAAHGSAKGQFASDRTVTLSPTTYSHLSFDADEFSSVEQNNTLYGVRWSATQTLPQDLTPGASGAAYPTLTVGAMTELPFTQKKRFQTIVSKMESGPKYTFAEFGVGLTNFPADGLMAWEINEPKLDDTDTALRIAHFLANWGMAFSFPFTDEDGTTYNGVFYGSDTLTVNRIDVNLSSIRTTLVQMHSLLA